MSSSWIQREMLARYVASEAEGTPTSNRARLVFIGVLLLSLLVSAGGECGPIERRGDFGARIVSTDTEPQNWLSHGRGYREDRHSPLDQIDAANVERLGLAWSYDLDTNRGQEATPLVVDGVLFTTSAWSKVQAFEADTGKLLWQFDPKVPEATLVKGCCDAVNRGAAYWNGRVYVASYDGRLIAINAKTGRQVWSVLTVDSAKNYTITGAPRIAKGLVFIGNAGAEYGVRGYITAYDAETGKKRWRFYTVPGPDGKPDHAASDAIFQKMARATWRGQPSAGPYGFGGGTVWDSIVYDPELDLLYFGVGNGSYWTRKLRASDGGDNLFLSSIVAVNARTGEYVWHFQEVPGDEWDYDSTSPMILADLQIGGVTRKTLIQAPKCGFFYVLDRVTGKFIQAAPYVPNINWATGLDPTTGRATVNPDAEYDRTGRTWIGIPGTLGGHLWQPIAYNSETGLVYIPVHETASIFVADSTFKPLPTGMNLGIDLAAGNLPDDPKDKEAALKGLKGYLLAWDPVRQREVWRAPHSDIWNGGVLTTSGNLVIEGDGEGRLNVYNAATGTQLWSYDVGSAIIGSPISYAVNGKQYITVLSGFGGGFAQFGGEAAWGRHGIRHNKSRVLTFTLDGSATLAPTSVPTAERPPPPPQFGDAAMISRGSFVYHRTCSICHGGGGTAGGSAPDLRHSRTLADKALWEEIVWRGALRAVGMVGFKENFSSDDIEAVRAYMISRAQVEDGLRSRGQRPNAPPE